jgi:hypothetical protein
LGHDTRGVAAGERAEAVLEEGGLGADRGIGEGKERWIGVSAGLAPVEEIYN